MGNVVHVRVMSDRGDPKKGYAFVEYDNADAALAAIQNLANVEVDGRKLRVGFSNNSGLEAIAKQRGLTVTPGGGVSKSLESVMAQFSVHEMYDMVAHLKEVAEARPEELRTLLISHPQIAEAIVHMQVKIGMIRPLARPGHQQPLPPPQPLYGQQLQLGSGAGQHPSLPPPQSYYQPPQPPLPPPQPYPGALPPPQPYAPPPQQGGLGALDPAALAANPAASQEMIKQILELTPEQLAAVDPARRQMLMDLKNALLQSGGVALLQQGGGAGPPR